MSIGLCIMAREDCTSGKRGMSALVTFLRKEMDRRGMTQLDLEEASGIPDSTLSRLFNGKIAEPKGSMIAQLARALQIPFWELAQIAGFTTEIPGTPSAEATRLATLLESDPDLRSLMQEVAELNAEDRDVVQLYIESLRQRRQRRKKPRSSSADQ